MLEKLTLTYRCGVLLCMFCRFVGNGAVLAGSWACVGCRQL